MRHLKIILVMLSITGLLLFAHYSFVTMVKPGQVWIYKSPDPFKAVCVKRIVLDVKGGYVKYEDLASGYKNSTSLFTFLKNSHLKK